MKIKKKAIRSVKIEFGKKAFTLVEIIVTMGIIAIVALLVVGGVALSRKTATETVNRSDAKTIAAAMDVWYAKYGRYCDPSGLSTTELKCNSSTNPNAVSFYHAVDSAYIDANRLVLDNKIKNTFVLAAATGRYGLTLNDMKSHCDCSTSASKGGRLKVTQNSYYIVPAAWNCNTPLPAKNHIVQGKEITDWTGNGSHW